MNELIAIIWALPIAGASLAALCVQRPHHGLLAATAGAAGIVAPWIIGEKHGPAGFPAEAAVFWIGVSVLASGALLALLLSVVPSASIWPRLLVAAGASALIATAVTVVINTVPMG